MRTSLVRRLGVLFVALVMTAIAVIVQPQKVLAVTEIKDDTDLAHVQAYQFTMTQENMSVISQSGDVDMDVIPPETGRQQSTVFALKVGSDFEQIVGHKTAITPAEGILATQIGQKMVIDRYCQWRGR